ncbi:MAG: iron-sulfur cluster assembly accessory protein [Planctomycetota bacterium]
MITVTDSAAQEIQRLLEGSDDEAHNALRLYVQGGGCAGMTYKMDFVTGSNPGDKTFDLAEGVLLVVDPKSYLFLNGVTMDFKESLMGRGFVFENPNASGACGCGTSFSVN